MTEVYDAEFVDVNPQAGYAAAGPASGKTARARKAKKPGASALVRASRQAKPPRTGAHAFGRLDILLQRSLRKFVEESGNGILMAAYGRYGDLVNDKIRRTFGPVGRGIRRS